MKWLFYKKVYNIKSKKKECKTPTKGSWLWTTFLNEKAAKTSRCVPLFLSKIERILLTLREWHRSLTFGRSQCSFYLLWTVVNGQCLRKNQFNPNNGAVSEFDQNKTHNCVYSCTWFTGIKFIWLRSLAELIGPCLILLIKETLWNTLFFQHFVQILTHYLGNIRLIFFSRVNTLE